MSFFSGCVRKPLSFFYIIAAGVMLGTGVPAFGVSQFVLPKNISVGDTAELHYMFQSEANLFLEEEYSHAEGEETGSSAQGSFGSSSGASSGGSESRASLELKTDISAFTSLSEKCLVQKAELFHVDAEYTLVLTLVVWKVGEVDFPPFNLLTALNRSFAGGEILIDLEPFTVLSVVERTQAQGLRPPSPPIIVPGTTVYLVLFAILFVVVVAAFIVFLTKIPAISSFLHDSRSVRQAKRYARRAIKKLRALDLNNKKMEMLDKEYCAQIQKILRSYLQHRFHLSFKTMSTSEFSGAFYELFDGEIPSEKQDAVESLTALFTRTDYLRYSEDAEAVGNVDGLVTQAISVVNAFDIHPEEDGETKSDGGQKAAVGSTTGGASEIGRTGGEENDAGL